jgi:hypothetical protein
MRTFIFLLLCFLFLSLCARAQTAMAFEMNVRRIPTTAYAKLSSCEVDKVTIYLYKHHIGLTTSRDTLLLRRLESRTTEERRMAITRDELHFNQLYLVTLVQDRESMSIFVTPIGQAIPGTKLYSIIISSKPICDF